MLTFLRICKHHPFMLKCQSSQGVYIHARNRHNRLVTSNIQRPTRFASGTLPPREQTSPTRISAPVKTQEGMRSRLGWITIRHLAVLFRTPLSNFDATATGTSKNNNDNFARASHFFAHFFTVFALLRRENA